MVTYGSFSAKVDGTSKSYPVNYYITNSGMSVISGTETGGTSISLSLFSTAVGSQDIDGIFTSASYIVGTTSKSAASGKIAITKIGNNKISGTFEFVVTGGVTVTAGTFTDVPLK